MARRRKRKKEEEDLLALMAQTMDLYRFGGGTVGGNLWNYRQPTTIERMSGINSPIPELKPEFRGKATSMQDFMSGAAARRKIDVIPSGALGRQEFWGQKSSQERGRYVEAPERFVRGKGTSQKDRAEQFYSTITGEPMGTMMGTGEYEKFGSDEYQALGKASKAARETKRAERRKARRAEQEAPQEGQKSQAEELPPPPKGYVYNRFGNLEPEEWYIEDEETGQLRKKTLAEYRNKTKKPSKKESSWRMSLLGGAPSLDF